LIDPCGFPVSETSPISMQTILGRELDLQKVKDRLVYRFSEVFNKKEVDYGGIRV
jgi:lipoate-protein ligase B